MPYSKCQDKFDYHNKNILRGHAGIVLTLYCALYQMHRAEQIRIEVRKILCIVLYATAYSKYVGAPVAKTWRSPQKIHILTSNECIWSQECWHYGESLASLADGQSVKRFWNIVTWILPSAELPKAQDVEAVPDLSWTR